MERKSFKNENLHILAECAIMAAASFVLSLIKIYHAPYGGSITLASSAPVMLISYRRGLKWGAATGFVTSILQILVGLSDIAWVPSGTGIFLCVLLDYLLPFTAIGLAGMFRSVKLTGRENLNIPLTAGIGAVVVSLVRFACHVLSGAVVWYSLTKGWYADDPTHIVNKLGMWGYSVVYNASYMLPDLLIAVAVTVLLAKVVTLRGKKAGNL